MSWRNFDEHKDETRAVKEALKKAGINAKVGHGKGTAWAWLEITLTNPNPNHQFSPDCPIDCPDCVAKRTLEEKAEQIAQQTTGRHGEYGGRINIYWQ